MELSDFGLYESESELVLSDSGSKAENEYVNTPRWMSKHQAASIVLQKNMARLP